MGFENGVAIPVKIALHPNAIQKLVLGSSVSIEFR